MKKQAEINECNKEECVILRKKLFEANLIIQELNRKKPADYEYTVKVNGMPIIYPVGFALHELRIKAIDELNNNQHEHQLYLTESQNHYYCKSCGYKIMAKRIPQITITLIEVQLSQLLFQ